MDPILNDRNRALSPHCRQTQQQRSRNSVFDDHPGQHSFHLSKLIENPTFGDQLMSILWNGVILYLEYPIKGKRVPISPEQNNNRFFPPIFYANTAIFSRALNRPS